MNKAKFIVAFRKYGFRNAPPLYMWQLVEIAGVTLLRIQTTHHQLSILAKAKELPTVHFLPLLFIYSVSAVSGQFICSLKRMHKMELRWSPFNPTLTYLFVLIMVLASIVRADLENVEEPQPKRGNNALLSRYGRALLSRYGKRSVGPINPPPFISDDRITGDFNKGEWLLCQEGMNNELLRCFPFSKH